MLQFILRRMFNSLLSLAVLITLIFFFARLTGNPTDLYVPQDTSEEVRNQIAEERGFNDPVMTQFVQFLSDLSRGDLGDSLRFATPAINVVSEALPTTLTLAAFAIPIATLLALTIGSLAAINPGGLFDSIASATSLGAASLPDFWLAIVGILIFAVYLHWLPTSGMGTPLHWVLPVGVLILRPLGILTQVVRNSMIAALSSDYVRAAQAKGITPVVVVTRHAMPNAIVPTLMVVADQSASILNGAIVIELIFGLSGVGRLLLDSIVYRDFNLLQAVVLVSAVLIFAVTALADILHALLDPRVDHG